MNCRCYHRVMLLAPIALGLCLTGCWRINKNSSQNPGPTNTKVNVLGPFPVGQRMVSEAQLKDLGIFYLVAANDRQPPGSLEDLDIKLQAPTLYQAIADKRIKVYWKANPNNAPAGKANTVLAYDADVETKRSAVLMLDGTVTVMDPQEFAKAPKAGQ
jgi:hypothetical protein